MQFCPVHWLQLRAAIEDRGMSHLVATSGEEASAAAQRHLDGTAHELDDFDPLMNAHWAIINNALQNGGTYLMFPDDEGNDRCPLCELDKHYPGEDAVATWVGYATDEQLNRARELGLIARVQ